MKKLALLALLFAFPALADAPQVGVIGALTDKVTARGEKGERALKNGSEIFLGDKLTADKNGKAQVMFLDKSSLTVSPNSEVTIDAFVYNPAEGTGDITIRNAKGALRFIGGALSKNKAVSIKTPVATIGIRGGIVDAHVAPGTGATDAIFLFGAEMTVQSLNGDTLNTTRPGSGLSVADAKAPPTFMPPAAVAEKISVFGPPSGDSKQQPGGPDVKKDEQGRAPDSMHHGDDAKNPENADNKEGAPMHEGERRGPAPNSPHFQPYGGMDGEGERFSGDGYMGDSYDSYDGYMGDRYMDEGFMGDDFTMFGDDRMKDCTTCQDWGMWATEAQQNQPPPVDPDDVINNFHFYDPDPITQGLSTNVTPLGLGVVEYRGGMDGLVINNSNGTIFHQTGSFAANIDLNTRTFKDFDGNFAGMRFGFTGQAYSLPAGGDADFAALPVYNLGPGLQTDITGDITGALLHPQAQGIGGNFFVNQGSTDRDAIGNFNGLRP